MKEKATGESSKYLNSLLLNFAQFGVRLSIFGSVLHVLVDTNYFKFDQNSLGITTFLYAVSSLVRYRTSVSSLDANGYSATFHEKMIIDIMNFLAYKNHEGDKSRHAIARKVKDNPKISARTAGIAGVGVGIGASYLTGVGFYEGMSHFRNIEIWNFVANYLLCLSGETLFISSLNSAPSKYKSLKNRKQRKTKVQ